MRNGLGLLSSAIEFLPLLQVVALYKYPMTSEVPIGLLAPSYWTELDYHKTE